MRVSELPRGGEVEEENRTGLAVRARPAIRFYRRLHEACTKDRAGLVAERRECLERAGDRGGLG